MLGATAKSIVERLRPVEACTPPKQTALTIAPVTETNYTPLGLDSGMHIVDSETDEDGCSSESDGDDVVALRALHPSIASALAVEANTDLSSATIMIYEVR